MPDVIVHGRMFMHKGEAGDRPAVIYLLLDDSFCFIQTVAATPGGKGDVGNIVVMKKFGEPFNVYVQRVYAAFSGTQVWLHDVGKVYIGIPGYSCFVMRIQAGFSFVKFKVETAVADRDCTAAAYIHPIGGAPFLCTAIGRTNIKMWKFFFHFITLSAVGENPYRTHSENHLKKQEKYKDSRTNPYSK